MVVDKMYLSDSLFIPKEYFQKIFENSEYIVYENVNPIDEIYLLEGKLADIGIIDYRKKVTENGTIATLCLEHMPEISYSDILVIDLLSPEEDNRTIMVNVDLEIYAFGTKYEVYEYPAILNKGKLYIPILFLRRDCLIDNRSNIIILRMYGVSDVDVERVRLLRIKKYRLSYTKSIWREIAVNFEKVNSMNVSLIVLSYSYFSNWHMEILYGNGEVSVLPSIPLYSLNCFNITSIKQIHSIKIKYIPNIYEKISAYVSIITILLTLIFYLLSASLKHALTWMNTIYKFEHERLCKSSILSVFESYI